jgi:hypothetical protein
MKIDWNIDFRSKGHPQLFDHTPNFLVTSMVVNYGQETTLCLVFFNGVGNAI